ncbi:DUF1203 domain-containing protein [Ornithinimicrobium cavernae]|uniref:DUF1203 domain-containing protein n=1 Tax=Ornithinimicrobium cavernae TaxID=2666047 RepID=UPI000D69C50A|nr:DUF1203 domain-containing protein [Ornithinimicrobium cavernae]
MTTYVLEAIDPAELAPVRAHRVDAHGNAVTVFASLQGGEQMRCCLELSERGDRVATIAHAPLGVPGPYREVGPVFVHAEACAGRPPGPEVPDWFADAPRVLRAYTSAGTMHHPANRVVETGQSVAEALANMFDDPVVAEAHVRNLVAQCFIARAVRQRPA